jgi:hypothetical protein
MGGILHPSIESPLAVGLPQSGQIPRSVQESKHNDSGLISLFSIDTTLD